MFAADTTAINFFVLFPFLMATAALIFGVMNKFEDN